MSCSLWTRLVRTFARIFCGQTIILFIIVTTSGCVSGDKPPASVIVHVTVVSVGLGAAYPLADLWMAHDVEFGAVTVRGGGPDSCLWVEKAVPPDVADEYVAWVIACAKKVDGIISVVVEVNDKEVAIWRAPVQRDLGELVEVLVIVVGDDSEGFAAHWSPTHYHANKIQHEGNSWTFQLHEFYVKEFARHVSFVGKRGRIAVQHGITKISVFQSLADGENKHIDSWIAR